MFKSGLRKTDLRGHRRKRARRATPFPLVAAFVVGMVACGSLVAAIAGGGRAGKGRAALQGSLPLAQENIYAGSRRLASEQPVAGPSLSPPTNVVATATSGTSITISWTAPTGSIASYNVLRKTSLSDPGVTQNTGSTATSFIDTVTTGAAYLYEVSAVPTSGSPSNYSSLTNLSFATAYSLSLSPSVAVGNAITAQQVNSIRKAIAYVLVAAQLTPPSGWLSGSSISSDGPVQASDVSTMQSELASAYSALGFSPPAFNRSVTTGLAVEAADYSSVAQATRAAN